MNKVEELIEEQTSVMVLKSTLLHIDKKKNTCNPEQIKQLEQVQENIRKRVDLLTKLL